MRIEVFFSFFILSKYDSVHIFSRYLSCRLYQFTQTATKLSSKFVYFVGMLYDDRLNGLGVIYRDKQLKQLVCKDVIEYIIKHRGN